MQSILKYVLGENILTFSLHEIKENLDAMSFNKHFGVL